MTRSTFFPSNGSEWHSMGVLLCDRCEVCGRCDLLARAWWDHVEPKEWTWEPFDLRTIQCSAFKEARP